MIHVDQVLARRSTTTVTVISLLLVALVGVVDYLSGPELSISIFYLMPISLAAWYAGRRLGLFVSLSSACFWYLADHLNGHVYSSPFIPYWNTGVRLGFFLISNYLISELRMRFSFEAHMAMTDPLTGIANRRGFYMALDGEMIRSNRTERPFTVAYLDVDRFKAVNDQLGHHIGDELLRTVATTLQSHVRKLDTVARLGGDEFTLLLPETGQEAAAELLSRLQTVLTHQMRLRDWSVTFSIGAATFLDPPEGIDAMLHQTDTLLYAAKRDGKNTIRYAVIQTGRPGRSRRAAKPRGSALS